ncbi:staygreen family protein, partial [Chloroflexota bacterium]
FKGEVTPTSPLAPRCYTLTHSDSTGDLFLTIGTAIDFDALNNWQTRLMRDEVLAAWCADIEENPSLHVTCHVSGKWFSFGSASWRYQTFQYHLPQVLQAFRYGDRALFEAYPILDSATIFIHFNARQKKYNITESWGSPHKYRI